MEFTESTADTVIRIFQHRLAFLISAIHLLGAEGYTDAAGFTPVIKYNLTEELHTFLIQPLFFLPIII